MTTKITDFLTALGIRLAKGSIDANTDPTAAQVYQVVFEISEWLSHICAELDSEVGRKTASISLTDGTATYDDIVDSVIAVAQKGWLLQTYSRDEIELTTEEDSINYSPYASNECQPEKYYLDANGNLIFLQTPETSYTAKIPYWYHQSLITASSFAVTAATQANPCVLTTAAHCFQTGDRIYLDASDVTGMTELTTGWYTVTWKSTTTFSLDGVNSTAYGAWTGGGTVYTALPFNGIFDHIFTEFASIRFQDIKEYQQEFEQSWLKFLMDSARRTILARKGLTSCVSR